MEERTERTVGEFSDAQTYDHISASAKQFRENPGRTSDLLAAPLAQAAIGQVSFALLKRKDTIFHRVGDDEPFDEYGSALA